jgi:hypothetical protein
LKDGYRRTLKRTEHSEGILHYKVNNNSSNRRHPFQCHQIEI